ncbi:MAG: thiamine phosphate synthase [Rhodospirillales bacterium]|jgi:thiamine-phosphate pyrophosphorylase|nr:thiamine phosphate synthase [Rhodospirillales bacterium]MDP6805820.1 thiamine phosphate synthase [Rhodospirillales bacterium]
MTAPDATDRASRLTTDGCRLYLITPPRFELAAFADVLAGALDAGDIACLQLRIKGADDDSVRRAADALIPVAHARNVAVVMNDRPDLAHETGCDGVHIGQSDARYDQARRALGAGGIVGVTCHASRHLAIAAAELGADYVAFGAFFETGTKMTAHRPKPEVLRWWSDTTTVPSVAIGGITPHNCAPLVEAGADFLAVVSAIWDHPVAPARAVREFAAAITRATSSAIR